jgi:hypothetical protein
MDTLHDRLAELADDAPTGGVPAAELWGRGKRAHRLRAAAVTATLVVLGTVGTGIGVRLADGDGNRSSVASPGAGGIALPIKYPAGGELPGLGDKPGPLAAIWLAPRVGGGPPEVVGLVAETGTFGTLRINVSYNHEEAPDAGLVALSTDGRRIAYEPLMGGLIVRDLVSGETYSPEFAFEIRGGYTWVDGTHLVGHVAAGSDVDGWVWDVLEPGTAPKLVDLRTYPGSPWLGPHRGRAPWFHVQEDGDRRCSSPTVHESGWPMLCDVLGVIDPGIVLTHWDDEVVALDRADSPFQDSPRRRVVAAAGAPELVTFASDLIGAALDGDGGGS